MMWYLSVVIGDGVDVDVVDRDGENDAVSRGCVVTYCWHWICSYGCSKEKESNEGDGICNNGEMGGMVLKVEQF